LGGGVDGGIHLAFDSGGCKSFMVEQCQRPKIKLREKVLKLGQEGRALTLQEGRSGRKGGGLKILRPTLTLGWE